MQVNELQMKLQPATPPEVQEKREIKLKSGITNIFVALVDYGNCWMKT